MAPRQVGGGSWRDTMPDQSSLYDVGYYDLALEEGTIDPTQAGFKQYRYTTRIIKPKSHEGQVYFARFVMGNENDPDATDPETWTRGFAAERMKSFLVAVEAPDAEIGPAFDKMFLKLSKSKACVHLGQNIAKATRKDGTPNPYAGQPQQTDKWYKLGERDPGLLSAGNAAPARRGRREDIEDEPPPRSRRAAPANGADDEPPPARTRRADYDDRLEEDDERPRARRGREARE